MASPVLALDRVSKRYGDRAALREVTFQLAAGESVGYLGPNGAGKTTTLKLITGLARATAGEVRVLGHDPVRAHSRALARLGGLVEMPGVAPYVHGRDLLDYVARVRDVPPAERPAAVRRAAERLSVVEHIDRPIGGLSTGLARRVLLSAALVGDPDVVVLDEPTLGLDPVSRSDLRRVLRGLSQSGAAVLLSTHLLEDVQEVCDRVLFLKDGHLVGDEPVRPEGSSGGEALRLSFARELPRSALASLEAAGWEPVEEGSGTWLVRFGRGPPDPAAVIAAVVRAGLPLTGASPPEPDLARRYLEKVGRDEAT